MNETDLWILEKYFKGKEERVHMHCFYMGIEKAS